jgi:ADP-heptose:LPS heptosyltransferase
MTDRILAVRGDGIGDVVLAEPAIRALAADGDVTLLCSAAGLPAAELVPSVSRTLVHDLPWIRADAAVVDAETTQRLVAAVRDLRVDRAVIFTSAGQAALPTALLLRLAEVPFIAARSLDHAGPLLDVRLSHDPPEHEVERNLELVEALGLPAPFDRRLKLRTEEPRISLPSGSVVVHPGATVATRTLTTEQWCAAIDMLARAGHPVVVTGVRGEPLAEAVRNAPGVAVDLVGRTSLPQLAGVLQSAEVLCIGHAGPMQLAAAVGTPVVATLPSSLPHERWRPWMVEHTIVWHVDPRCAGCARSRCRDHPAPSSLEDLVAAVANESDARLGAA